MYYRRRFNGLSAGPSPDIEPQPRTELPVLVVDAVGKPLPDIPVAWYGEDGSVYKLGEAKTDREGRAVFDTASKEGQYLFTAALPEGIASRRLRTFPGHLSIITVFRSAVASKPSIISGVDIGMLAIGTVFLVLGMPRHNKPLGVLATSIGVIAIGGTTIDIIKKVFA